jgi:hypothetical protein
MNCLNFLNCVLQVLPVSISSDIVKKLTDYTQGENTTLKKNIYFVIETMFAATKLSTSFVEDFLNYLLDNVPISADAKELKGEGELMIVGYCLAVSQVAVHYKKLNGERVLQYLPNLVSILSEFLISGNMRIKSGAFTSIKNLLFYSLEWKYFKEETKVTAETDVADLNFDLLTINENAKIHPIKKIIMMFQYCLNTRFESCYSEVLKLITTFIGIGGNRSIEFGALELLQKIGNLDIKKNSYKAWIDCQGKFLEKYKSEIFFQSLPMKLLDHDMNSESYSLDSRSYMIPVIQKYVRAEPLNFYIDNFLPLIELLSKAKKGLQKDNQFIKFKKYETLILQIWEIFPSYIGDIKSYNYTDTVYLQHMFKKWDKIIEKNLFNGRSIILKNICVLIDFYKSAPKENLNIKKARVYLMKNAVTYISRLSLLYLDAPSADSSDYNVADIRDSEHFILLKTISKFGWISKRTHLYDLFFNELTSIVEEFTIFETGNDDEDKMDVDDVVKRTKSKERVIAKNKILRKIDIIISLMERIKLSKKHCELIIKFADSIAKSKVTQKKAFKILSIILGNYEVTTFKELKEMFSKLTGYAFSASQQKHKLIMLKIFLGKIRKPKKETDEMEQDDMQNEMAEDSDEEDPEVEAKKVDVSDEDRNEITLTVLPEIITGFAGLQAKSKKLSESLLVDLVKLHRNHFSELLKKLLAGFSGNKVDTRSATISILTKVLKTNHEDFTESNLKKIMMIIILFLKESSGVLQKAVLKCIKRIIVVISKESIEEIAGSILNAITEFSGRQKMNVYVKYIIKKLVRKLGRDEVKRQCPEEHHALIDYVDKMMRRAAKALQKARELIAEDDEEREKNRLLEGDRLDEFKDSDDDQSSDSDSDEEGAGVKKDDQIVDYDIPMVRNLQEIENNNEEDKTNDMDRKTHVDKILTAEYDEFNSHFYENPVMLVKKRKEERKRLEEINKRQRDRDYRKRNSKSHYSEDENDLFYEKKTNKFVVKDALKNDRQVKQVQNRKRKDREEYLDKMLPKEVRQMIDLEEKAKNVHKRVKTNDSAVDIDSFIPMKYLNKKGKDKSLGKC